MRVFVLITSIAPVRAFLSIQGLARLCAAQYELPTDQNLHNAQMHLTNYAVNKPGSDRAEADSAPQTHAVKRTLMDVFEVRLPASRSPERPRTPKIPKSEHT